MTLPDYEVPIGKCIDWLAQRSDVDTSRIAVSGSSLGGYYAARAGAMEPRLAACISHGAIWDIHERWKARDDNHGLAGHIKWVFGAKSMAEATEIARPFNCLLCACVGGMAHGSVLLEGGWSLAPSPHLVARGRGAGLPERPAAAASPCRPG